MRGVLIGCGVVVGGEGLYHTPWYILGLAAFCFLGCMVSVLREHDKSRKLLEDPWIDPQDARYVDWREEG